MAQRIRIVVAGFGQDGDDRGAKAIARALRDAGMEVVYTGSGQTPEQIVQTVVQEDADALGLSIFDGAHRTLLRRIRELLTEHEADDVVLFGTGIAPEADLAALEATGIATGTTVDEIVEWVRTNVAAQSVA